jgi:transposase
MIRNNELNFKDQIFYIGLDVHKKSWSVTIRTNEIELKTFSMNPNPIELHKYMRKNYPGGIYKSVYEAGFSGFWIHRELEKLGFKSIVTNAADVPTSHKEKARKTDPVDSRKLSRELEDGSLEAIYVPDSFHEQLRSLSRLRIVTSRNQARVKNRIKGLLNCYGIKVPQNFKSKNWSGAFIKYLESLEFQYPFLKDYLNFSLEELKQHRLRLSIITKKLKIYFKEYDIKKYIDLLRSVPGIGTVIAIALYCELTDIKRFPTLDKLASFIGLVPNTSSSGENDKTTGLTNRFSKYLRYLLIEAAWIATRKDPALTLYYSKLTKRMDKQLAILYIAKKLLNRILYVWKNQKPYVYSVVK